MRACLNVTIPTNLPEGLLDRLNRLSLELNHVIRLCELPESLSGGFARTEISAYSGGSENQTFGAASATYKNNQTIIKISIIDLGQRGGSAGLMGLVAGASASNETPTSYTKIHEVNGRMVVEEFHNDTNSGHYAILLGKRIMVNIEGTSVSMDNLKSTLASLDPDKIEGLAK